MLAASSATGYEASPGQVSASHIHQCDSLLLLLKQASFFGVCFWPPYLSCSVLLIQGFAQQNSGANQGNYGAPEAGPGIDQSLSAHVPGGQGVSTATEQVIVTILATA